MNTKSGLFQASIRNCLNCVHNCDDLSSLDFKLCFEDKVYQKANFKNLRADFILSFSKVVCQQNSQIQHVSVKEEIDVEKSRL